VFFGAVALGQADTAVALGSLVVTPTLLALALALASPVIYVLFRAAGALGFGPLARPPDPGDPVRRLEPPAAPPRGWLRPGWLVGLPIAWAAISLVAIPLVVYVVSYIPWSMIEDHQLWAGVPAGHAGQTLADLTVQMYNYHNSLTAAHPASSPWWAWPFDLKPVWFYQDGFAGDTTAAIYNAGNLVIWWLGVPAMAFAAIMAYRRRSLALALIAIGFAAQWIPWARIDRAAFQYHYYTALPFVVLALAYLVAELWHGASRRTWLAARVAAAAAIVAPAALWVLSRPLCAFVGVETVNPDSQACPAVIPEAVITVRTIGLLIVVAFGTVALARSVLALDGNDAGEGAGDGEPRRNAFLRLALTAGAVAIGFVVAALLPETTVATLTSVPVEPIAFVIGLPLVYLAATALAARDAHRFVVGLMGAVVAWLAIVYPNIAALPLPSVVVNAYQGILPTYLYAFQFPVSTADRTLDAPLGLEADRRRIRDGDRGRRLVRRRLGRQPGPQWWRCLRDLGAEARRQRAGCREPPDDEPVVVVHFRRDPRPAELLGPRPTGLAHPRPQSGIAQEAVDRDREFLGFTRRDQQCLTAAADHALVAVDVGADDGRPGGHRLEQDDPEGLATGRR
jgi:hypothetical protein